MNPQNMMISQKTLEEFYEYLAKNMGLSFSKESQKGIEMKIVSIVHAFGRDDDPEGCLIDLMDAPPSEAITTKLAHYLSVGETYFFRDSNFFALLENQLLPGIIKRKQHSHKIRIWSAACATGEEPYSIAMLLHRLIPNLETWDIQIIASDINTKFLQHAEKGHYKRWSFRTTPSDVQNLYFEMAKHDLWVLKPAIRKMVKFCYANLVDAFYPAPISSVDGFDLIICNNVLIYFTADKINHTVHQLSNLLREGGWLCVTAIEVPYIQDPYLKPWYFGNSIVFKKMATPNAEPTSAFTYQSEPLSIPKAKEPSPQVELLDFFKLPVEQPKTPLLPQPVENTKPKEEDEIYPELDRLFKAHDYAKTTEKIEHLLEPCHDSQQLKKYLPHMNLLIHAYANQKKLEEALEWCHKYLEVNVLNAEIHYIQATILQELNHLEEAAVSLRKALYLDSDFVIAHFALGCLLEQMKRSKDAERSFRNALKLLEPYPPDAILPGTEGVLAGNLKEIIQGKNTR